MRRAGGERSVHLKIDRIVVTARSAIEARRLADALPSALHGVLTGGPPQPRGRFRTPAELAAHEIATQVFAAVGRRP